MRRWAVMIAALLFGALTLAPVVAQEATPGTVDGGLLTGEELGLGEATIRYTDAGFEGPAEIAAGRTLMTFENASQAEFAGFAFLAIPTGESIDDVNARLDAIRSAFSGEGGSADGTPEAMPEMGTPPADAMGTPPASDDPTAWLYTATFAGGTAAAAGEHAQVIVELTPGEWAIWDEAFQSDAVAVTVTGDMATPAATAGLTPSVVVTEIDTTDGFAFEIEGTFASGRQIVEITNNSTQPHFMELDRSPSPLTEEQLMQLLMLEPGTPAPEGLPNPDEIEIYAFASTQSSGTTQWLVVDVEPGTYIVACWIPDPTRGGVPHALEGMIEIVDVS